MDRLLHFFNTNKKFLSIFAFAILFNQVVLSQTTTSPVVTSPAGCTYTVTMTVKGVDCKQNGEISITINPINGDMPNRQYRVYPKGTDGDAILFSPNNVWAGLAEGDYIVEVKAHCVIDETTKEPNPTSSHEVTVPRTKNYEQAKLQAFNTRKTLPCGRTGSIRLVPVASQKGPFKIKITKFPSTYTPARADSIVWETVDVNTVLPSEILLEGFPVGSYNFRLTDGCDGDAGLQSGDLQVEATSDNFYSSMFYQYIVTPQRNYNFSDPSYYLGIGDWSTDKTLTYFKYPYSLASTHEMYEYFSNWHKYYDYAWVFPGEDPNSFTEDRWEKCPSYTTIYNSTEKAYPYINYNSDKTLKQMRDDKTNLVPQLALRVRNSTGGVCSKIWSFNWINYALYSTTVAGCDDVKITSGINSNFGEYAVLAFPYEWKITDTENNIIVQQSGPNDSIQNYYSTYLTTLSAGRYKLTYTDRQGFAVENTFTLVKPANNTYGSYTAKNAVNSYCTVNDSVAIYIYGSGGGTLAKARIKFVPYSSSDATSSSQGIPTPVYTDITLPSTYTSNFYPYSTTYTSATYNGYLSSQVFRDVSTTRYAAFDVTDSCGVTKRLRILPGSSRSEYFHTADPTFDIDINCGWATVKPTNLDTIIKYRLNFDTNASSSSITSYLRVKPTSIPTGATVAYSNSSNYCVSGTDDRMYFSKSGTYTIQVSRNASFYTTLGGGYCTQEYTVTVVVPEFGMDSDKSVAYRCPDNSSVGYIQVLPVNGSGNYWFELFKKDDFNSLLDENATGIFTNWAGVTTEDSVSVRITDLDCSLAFSQKIGIHDLNDAVLLWVEGSPRKCFGDEIKLHALPLGENATYEWTFPNGDNSYVQNPVISSATLAHSGKFKVKIGIQGCTDSYVEQEIDVYIADRTMYWNPNATDNNWHKTENWLIVENNTTKVANAVPAPCTTVHIAGNASYYPNLDQDNTPRVVDGIDIGAPACDTIIYHYGSETMYPHLLRYKQAKIQYNFSYYGYDNPTEGDALYFNKDDNYPVVGAMPNDIPTMDRARWYMIAAPLKNITGGDFGVAGYPNMYQKLYNTANPSHGFVSHDGFTKPFNKLSDKLENTGNAMALLASDAYNYVGWNNHKHLEALEGVIELPFYLENDPSVMGYHLQAYDGTTSAFQYYDLTNLQPMNRYDYLARDNRGSRFVFENSNDTVDVIADLGGKKVAMYQMQLKHILEGGTTNRVMVGNPLMCHVDFEKIYAHNSDVIKPHYWLITGDEVFVPYIIGGGVANTITKNIAPLQGFIIELLPQGTRTRDYLQLPLEGDYSIVTVSTTALDKPKTAKVVGNSGAIVIDGLTPSSNGKDTTSIRSAIFFNSDMTNTLKLVSSENLGNKAETFILSDDGTANSYQVENGQPTSVKLGVYSLYAAGDVVLRFTVDGTLIDEAILWDKVSNVKVDVTKGGNYKYKHRTTYKEGDYYGHDTQRFELLFKYKSSTGIDSEESSLLVRVNKKELSILSGNPINNVELINASGSSAMLVTNVDSYSFQRLLDIPSGVYIVKVTLKNGESETHKIILE